LENGVIGHAGGRFGLAMNGDGQEERGQKFDREGPGCPVVGGWRVFFHF
jgi:hypothetical protein